VTRPQYQARDFSTDAQRSGSFRTRRVHRTRLLERLNAADPAHLTLLRAPAGYGKSDLLANWARTLRAKETDVVWLDVDETLTDPLRFLGALLASARRVRADQDAAKRPPAAQPQYPIVPEASLRETIAWIADDLASRPRPLLFIIDDYDRARSDALDSVLRDLLRQCGPQVRFCVASQAESRLSPLPDPSGRDVVELVARDLRFTDAEISALFDETLTVEELSRISVWTEGWPVAVQLVRQVLSMPHAREQPIAELLAASAKGDHARHLAEQVLRNLPAAQRELLIETSFLDVLQVDLVGAVTGRDDSWRLLAALEASTTLLTPIDDDPAQGYRCHRLIRDVMFRQLRRRGRRELAARQRAAALWFRQEGDLRQAMRHAADAGDSELAAQLALDAGGIFYGVQHGAPALHALIEKLPAASFAAEPRLRLAQVFLLIKDGRFDAAEDIMRAIRERLRGGPPDRALERDLAMAIMTLDVYSGVRMDTAQMRLLAEIAEDRASPDYWLNGVVQNLLCVAQYRTSDFAKSAAAAEAADYYYTLVGSTNGLGHMRLYVGQLALEQGDVAAAIASYERAHAIFSNAVYGDPGGCALADVFLAEALYTQGCVEEARARCAPALQFAQAAECHYELLVAGYRTLSALVTLESGLQPGIRVLDQGFAYAGRRRFPELENYLQLRRTELELGAGERAGSSFRAVRLPEPHAQSGAVWLETDLARLLEARLLLGDGDLDEAVAVLERQLELVQRGGRVRSAVSVLLQLALTHEAQGARDRALARLHQAVRLARKGPIQAPFLEQGRALLPLLMQLARPSRPGMDDEDRTFLDAVMRSLHAVDASGTPLLSEREHEVVMLLAAGKNNKLMARDLGISPETVRFHLKSIYEKFGVSDRRVVVELAQQRGLLPP
jgi:LuxR family transcriptional regulator, maltose regulon positive regulatory protein